MIQITFGLAMSTAVIVGIVFLIYIISLFALGWESHSKYGLGFHCVGTCILGFTIAYFNYKYWLDLKSAEGTNYNLITLIVSNLFLIYLGLWLYLVYHFFIMKRVKAVRAGSRLMIRILAKESDESESIDFKDELTGWNGDPMLDRFISESNFSEATAYMELEIQKAIVNNDRKKASEYEQYKAIIERESYKSGESEIPDDEIESSQKTEDIDIKRTTDIDKQDLPEGWEIND